MLSRRPLPASRGDHKKPAYNAANKINYVRLNKPLKKKIHRQDSMNLCRRANRSIASYRPEFRLVFKSCGGRLQGMPRNGKGAEGESSDAQRAVDATMAVFLDLENIALGARTAQFPPFNIKLVLERLLLRGHIVVKKAYCDFDRYKEFKKDLHEAAFELIEIPHVRQSGKNSADIRMVVDALDLCYTKQHLDTFVILSGDSDFSPLVSKLRENDKTVIGVGVKSSSSDLFINNCDQFLYYDDLVREERKRQKVRPGRKPDSKPKDETVEPMPAHARRSCLMLSWRP